MSVDTAGLAEELEVEARGDLVAFGETVVRRIQRMLIDEGHCEPGSPLLAKAFFELDADGGITVGLGSDVAVFLEFGTAPHIIEARPGGTLVSDSGQHFGPIVHHPGTEATYLVQRAVLFSLAEQDRP